MLQQNCEIKRVGQIKKYPDREDIARRLNLKFGGVARIAYPILATCAEEFEKILLESLSNREVRTVYVDLVRPDAVIKVKKRNHKVKAGYTCKGCSTRRIFNGYEYCPICGRKIEWV